MVSSGRQGGFLVPLEVYFTSNSPPPQKYDTLFFYETLLIFAPPKNKTFTTGSGPRNKCS